MELALGSTSRKWVKNPTLASCWFKYLFIYPVRLISLAVSSLSCLLSYPSIPTLCETPASHSLKMVGMSRKKQSRDTVSGVAYKENCRTKERQER